MYITKHVSPRIVAAALRSVCNQACGPDLVDVHKSVGHLALQLMQEQPLDALEGSIAAEYIHMICDNIASWEYRVEILGH